jgi:hypothetical protein
MSIPERFSKGARSRVGPVRSQLARWGHARSTKHMQNLDYQPVTPVPCMFYMNDRSARICGDTEEQDLSVALDITESITAAIFFHEDNAKRVADRAPPRKR